MTARRKRVTAAGVTILIPNWNHRYFLSRAIGSARKALDALAAADVDGEVIVVDDGSRDGSQRFLRSLEAALADTRLQTVFLDRNRGLAGVRNLGLRLSRFRHVLLFDADNEVIPETLPLFARAIAETGATLVHGNLVVRRDGRAVRLHSGEAATMAILRRNWIDAFALVDADRILELGGFVEDPGLRGWEDWELVLHLLAEQEPIVFVPAVLGYYDENPRSMSELAARGRAGAPFEADQRYVLLQRMYGQVGSIEWLPDRGGRIYHPDVGYLDGWDREVAATVRP